jgi:hypothetical protein
VRSRWTSALIAFTTFQWMVNEWWVSLAAAGAMLLLLGALHRFVRAESARSPEGGPEWPWIPTASGCCISVIVSVNSGWDRFGWGLATTLIMLGYLAEEISDWRQQRSVRLPEPIGPGSVG